MNKNKISKLLAVFMALVMMAAVTMLATACKSSEVSEEPEEETEEVYESGIDATQIGEFETTDLNGNTVTQDIFKEADLTLVNFWATYCGPCIEEMPELQALSEEYSGRVTVLGVVCDMEDLNDSELNKEAEDITAGQGVKFASVIPQGSLYDIAYSLNYVPTTVIVDKEGNIVGEPVVGADIEAYKKIIDDYLAGN